MESVLKDTTSTTICEDQYQLYIDTTMKIEAKTYGTFVVEYDPLESDILLKRVPALKDLKLKRDPTDGQKRYFHTINKMKKEQILALRKVFNFVINISDEDTRLYLLDTPTLKILEYKDKSVAFFSADIATLVRLRELEGKGLKYYPSLTGPGMVKASGYLLFKSSKDYAKILQSFSSDTPLDLSKPSDSPKRDGAAAQTAPSSNKMENIAPGPKNETRFRIYGDTKYVDTKLVEIREDFGDNIKTLHDKTSSDGKRELEIEISADN